MLNKELIPALGRTEDKIKFGFDKVTVKVNYLNAAENLLVDIEPEEVDVEEEVEKESEKAPKDNSMDPMNGYASPTSSLGLDLTFRQYTEEQLMSEIAANSTMRKVKGRRVIEGQGDKIKPAPL